MQIVRFAVVTLLQLFMVVLFIRAILSMMRVAPGNRLAYYCERITEPVLSIFRKIIRRTGINNNIPFDLAYLFAFLLIGFIINAMYIFI